MQCPNPQPLLLKYAPVLKPGAFSFSRRLVCLLQIFWSNYPINGGFPVKGIGPPGDLQLYFRQAGRWKSLIDSAEQIQELLETGIMPNQQHFLSIILQLRDYFQQLRHRGFVDALVKPQLTFQLGILTHKIYRFSRSNCRRTEHQIEFKSSILNYSRYNFAGLSSAICQWSFEIRLRWIFPTRLGMP